MVYREPPTVPILIIAFSGSVFGVDPAAGTRVWEYELLSIMASGIRLWIEGDRIYAAGHHKLACLEYLTGRELWLVDYKVGHDNPQILVAAGRIYLGAMGEVQCFDRDGTLLWTDKFKGKGFGPVALAVPGRIAQVDF